MALCAAGVRQSASRLARALVVEREHPEVDVARVVSVLQLQRTGFVLIDVLVVVH